LNAGLEFRWPKTAQLYSERPPAQEATRQASLIDVTSGDVATAGHHSTECERVLRRALDRIVELENALRAAEEEVAESASAIETQQIHIDFLNTKARQHRGSRKHSPRR